MKQEDKELLLKDLCARLPYGVVVETQLVGMPRAKYPVLKVLQSYMLCAFMQTIENVIRKPYLRPMSSMTEEEKKEYKHLVAFSGSPTGSAKFVDWLNAHHFDYRGLIPMGLAIEVTKENNPYEE